MTKSKFIKYLIGLGYYKLNERANTDIYYIHTDTNIENYNQIDLRIDFQKNRYRILLWDGDYDFKIKESKEIKTYIQLINIIEKYKIRNHVMWRKTHIKQVLK
jgi:hypothetical protein